MAQRFVIKGLGLEYSGFADQKFELKFASSGRRVQGVGFRVSGVGFRVRSLGFGVMCLACRVYASWFRFQGLGLSVRRL